MTTFFKNLSLLVSLLFLVNCSNERTTSSVQINFQSKGVSAQSIPAEDIEVVIVNVSGPGIENKIVSQKDCHNEQICDSISLEKVPSGTKRLIQLLIVTREGTTGLESAIYYGDVTQELNGETTVAITIRKEDSFAKEADISGQYLPNSTHPLSGRFLTGSVDVDVQIPGKPSMTIGSAEIYGGWFKFFLLDTIRFRYFFEGWDSEGKTIGRTEIFNDYHSGDGLTIGKIMALPFGDKIVSFKAPANTVVREDRSSGTFEFRAFEQRIFAILGGINKNVCYDSTAVTTFDGNGNSRICTDTDSSATCDSFLAWSDLSITGSSAACDDDANEWELDVENIYEKDRFSGFAGLFTNEGDVDSNIVEFDGVNKFTWKIDPKVTLNGVHIFKLISNNFDRDAIQTNDISDGYNCNILKDKGFSGPQVASLSGNTYSHTITANEVSAKNNNNFYMVLCPLAPNGTYYKSAFLFDGDHGPHQVSPEKVSVRKISTVDGFSGNMSSSVCYPVEVALEDNSGVQAYSPSNETVTLSSDDGSGAYYESFSDCLGVTNAKTTVSTNDRSVMFYSTTSSTGSHNLSVSASGLTSGTFSYTATTISSVAEMKLVPSFHRSSLDVATTETCVPFYVAAFDTNGELTNYDGSTHSFDPSLAQNSSSTSRSFFGSEADCTAGTPVLGSQTPPAQSLYEVWYKNEDIAATSISNVLTSCSGGTCPSTSFNIVNPGALDHIHGEAITSGPHTASPGGCIKLKIGAYDNHQVNSFPVNFPGTGSFALSSNVPSATFHTDVSCLSGAQASLSVSGGQTEDFIYFKWPSASTSGSYEIDFAFDVDGETYKVNLDLQ